jgi:hypothetical protein
LAEGNKPNTTQQKAATHRVDGKNDDFVCEGQWQKYPYQGQQQKCQKNTPPPPEDFHHRNSPLQSIALWLSQLSGPFAEKVIFLRLLKNAQMQGARNPEE